MVLGVDPGPAQTAYAITDGRVVAAFGIVPNDEALELVEAVAGRVRLAIEMIASYGMAVGAEVFETCTWIGRFHERWVASGGSEPARVYRVAVKVHLCRSASASDSNVRMALLDRWGGKALAVGTSRARGPLYGIHKDAWSALAVAVTYLEDTKCD